MDLETLHNVIRGRFKTLVQDEISGGLPTLYDNDGAFEKPVDSTKWARVSVRLAESAQISIGSNPKSRDPGLMIVSIFIREGKGNKEALEIADVIRAAFRSVTVNSVTFRTPSAAYVGRRGNEWQLNVNCPFYTDVV